MSRLIRHAIDRVLGTLVSAEDVRRGFRDVEVWGRMASGIVCGLARRLPSWPVKS